MWRIPNLQLSLWPSPVPPVHSVTNFEPLLRQTTWSNFVNFWECGRLAPFWSQTELGKALSDFNPLRVNLLYSWLGRPFSLATSIWCRPSFSISRIISSFSPRDILWRMLLIFRFLATFHHWNYPTCHNAMPESVLFARQIIRARFSALNG